MSRHARGAHTAGLRHPSIHGFLEVSQLHDGVVPNSQDVTFERSSCAPRTSDAPALPVERDVLGCCRVRASIFSLAVADGKLQDKRTVIVEYEPRPPGVV